MVLSSQTTKVGTRHVNRTDVAACWGNLAGAAATGACGCKSYFLPNPLGNVGRHGNGSNPCCFGKYGVGCCERYNISPTGGRQYVGDGMRDNGVTLGDDQRAKGVLALRGASSAGRRIAQASNGSKHWSCGVCDVAYGRITDISDQNLSDSSGPSRDVEHTRQGKPRVRNICAAKGGSSTDCRANVVVMLVGLHLREIGQDGQITWEVPGYTSNTCFAGGRSGMGAAESRFKQVEKRLRCKPRVLVFRLGRKLLSVERSGHTSGWEYLRGITASNAEHQGVRGWPLKRQHVDWVGSWFICGQEMQPGDVLRWTSF